MGGITPVAQDKVRILHYTGVVLVLVITLRVTRYETDVIPVGGGPYSRGVN